jgi:major membrane immunogen (membrane-anchored lipoprotein)
MLKMTGMIVTLLLLSACGAGDSNKKPMLDKERQTLEKAGQVDAMQRQAAEQQRKQLEQQSQ